MEAPDEMQKITVTQQATKPNPETTKPTCHRCKRRATTETSVVNSKKRQTKTTPTKIAPATTIIVKMIVVKPTLTPTITKPSVMAVTTFHRTEMTENQELSTNYVRPGAKRTTPQRNTPLEPMQQTDCLFRIEDRWNKVKINNKTHRSI